MTPVCTWRLSAHGACLHAVQQRLGSCLPCPNYLPRPNYSLLCLQTLYDAFGVDGRLVVNYALTPAWG